MRWLSRRNASPGRHAAGRHRAPATVTAPEPVVTGPVVMPTRDTESGVHLGFADGSVLELAASDARANTFRALARALAQGHR